MRLSRRRLTLGRSKLLPGGKMSQERQKLSFFIVVIFLAVFGIIILAEVLFMDEQHGVGGKQGEYSSGKNKKNQQTSFVPENFTFL